MSIFSRKDKDDFFSAVEFEEDEIYIGMGDSEKPSHAITREEVIGSFAETGEFPETSALEQLKKRMLSSKESEAADIISSTPTKADEDELEHSKPQGEGGLFEFDEYFEEPKTEKTPTPAQTKTLLEKCRPYIVDEDGRNYADDETAVYTLESVSEILNNESRKTIERLSEKYAVAFDDLGKNHSVDAETAVFEDEIRESTTNDEPFVISDIDFNGKETEKQDKDISFTATVKFTPVSDSSASSRISVSTATRSVDLTGEISGLPDNDSDDIAGEVKLEQSEFEEFVPPCELNSLQEAKSLSRRLAVKKRSWFLKCIGTVILTLMLAFLKLPFMSGFVIERAGIITAAVLYWIAALLNIDSFFSLKTIFSKRCETDVLAAFSLISASAYAAVGIVKNALSPDLLLLGAVLLAARSVCGFRNCAAELEGLKVISSQIPKRSVKLINDPAVTFAMAKNSVDGDALVAAPQKTGHVDDYMKYTKFKTPLFGKLAFMAATSVIISVVLGFAAFYYFGGALNGLYAVAVIQCFAATPALFFIDGLPLYSSAKRLSKLGAMLAGKTGAEAIENANAAVFDSADLFPSGTVTLHNMQILSDNSIDDTLVRAAALTDTLNSPLAPMFKKIVGTGGDVIIPKADTVKYEDRMGISGWVDNKLLFVGNRTLMEAHGISVPSVETDRKLLRNGFFPVYVASEDKACALLAVQYSVKPEIAHELKCVSSLGVTMLINTSDPNMTEEMICDYMGLYDDSVKIMSAAGCHMYKNAVSYQQKCSSPAAYKGNPIGLAAIINCACRVKKSDILLSVMYILSAVIGAVLFIYASFNGSGSLISEEAVLIYGIVCTVVSYILYLTQKP